MEITDMVNAGLKALPHGKSHVTRQHSVMPQHGRAAASHVNEKALI
jgi:hypothetical protein